MILNILITILLFSICYIDVRERKVYVLQLVALGSAGAVNFFISDLSLNDIWVNYLWIFIQLAALVVYVKIRGLSFKHSFGAGDVVFFLFAPLFLPFPWFVAYYISGLILCALVGISASLRQTGYKVPLAGIMGLWLSIILQLQWFSLDFFTPYSLIDL